MPDMIICPECEGTGEVDAPSVDPRIGSHRYRVERGGKRIWLLARLARDEGSHQALATALGVSKSTIQEFRIRHREEIDNLRASMERELRELWIADKLARLAEMQQDVDDINAAIAAKMEAATPAPFDPLDPAGDGKATPGAMDDVPAWLRVKALILHAAAEELGQLPQRVNVQVGAAIVTYRLEGASLDKV